MPIAQHIRRHAETVPDKNAFVINNGAVTYGDLAKRSNHISNYLSELEADRSSLPLLNQVGKLVAICVGNHLAFPEIFLAATEYPFASAILDPTTKHDQIQEIFQNLKPDLVVVETMDSSFADIASSLGIITTTTSSMLDSASGKSVFTPIKTPRLAGDTFLVGFTSGTTSLPKAFFRSRSSWTKSLAASREFFELEDSFTTMCPGALGQGLALYALAETLYCGGTFHALEKWNAEIVAKTLALGDIQRLIAVPTMIMALSKEKFANYPSVKEVVTAGAKLNHRHVDLMMELFPNARIREYYGTSELGFVSVSTLCPPNQSTPIESVGRAFPGVELSIRQSGDSSQYETETGMIYVKSELICDGYLWGDDGNAFRVDEYGATVGDIGSLDKDGTLRFLGREGGMVVTGGHNVYPSEVESVLENIEGIEDAIVLGIDDDYLGKRLIAVVLGECDLDDIVKQAADFLPRFKIPRDFYRANSWPMTASGKIARKQVQLNLETGTYDHLQLST